MNISGQRRVSIKIRSPNPLFEKWLTEWRDKANEKDSKMKFCFSSALQSLRKYPLPLQSGNDCKILKGFGTKLCQMLQTKLTEYRKKGSTYNSSSNVDDLSCEVETVTFSAEKQSPNRKKGKGIKAVSVSSSNESLKEYIPQYRSGAYAIVVGLYVSSLSPQYAGHLNKDDVIKYAQPLCDKSFSKPDPGSFYTAWSSMKTLLAKKLIQKQSNPPKFSLTDSGIILGHKLYIKSNNFRPEISPSDAIPKTIHHSVSDMNDLEGNYSANACTYKNCPTELLITQTEPNERKRYQKESKVTKVSVNSSANVNLYTNMEVTNFELNIQQPVQTKNNRYQKKPTVTKDCGSSAMNENSTEYMDEESILEPNTFDIILYVDTQELSGGKANIQNEALLNELFKLSVPYEIQHLKVGDYTWICRDKVSKSELILPYIVERKGMDDLGSSIKDGRYHEQKFRLKRCGLQNLIYLIESYGKNNHSLGLPISSLYQAVTNTLVQDGFMVKLTDDIRGTAEYLACLTNSIQNIYKQKTIISCPKENLTKISIDDDIVSLMSFKEFNKTSSKLKNMKVKDMFVRQLLRIKGMSVAKALAIAEVYPTPKLLMMAYTDQSKGNILLSNVKYGPLKKNIGPTLSKIIFQFFNKDSF